jgi:UDP-GlcNAc:undecaprenyl-phosphate GlcNAc-1-phosphate transferase
VARSLAPGWQYLLVAGVAAVVSALSAPLAGLIGRRLGIVDRPGGRRRHRGMVPRLGGVPLFIGFTAAVVAAATAGILTGGYSGSDYVRLRGLIAGGAVAVVAGLLDDRFDLSPGVQMALHLLLAIVASVSLLWLERFTLPFLGYVALDDYAWGAWVYIPLTVVWVTGMINTVNWLDGLDGLAAGVGAILCVTLAIHMHRVDQTSVALLPIGLLGALIGFLPFNVAPARLFLGSAGAVFLGYMLAGMGLVAGGRIATVLLVMGLPIVDVAWQIFDRLRRRRSPGDADRGHLHFRLQDVGLSTRLIVLLYWGFCVVLALVALTVVSRLYKLITLIGLGVIVAGLLAVLSRRQDPR